MKRYTKKQLKELVNNGGAIDITNADTADYDRIKAAEGYLTQIGYAAGVNGCAGLLIKGDATGRLYAVTARSAAFFIFS